ncbi:Hypothetical predicted protein [Mytilus galloprovincialis]|uniref:Integrase catalytic domain-containing protein n=1 Tax=Mytilus galloprovincialis TaxID=29158 RepID=A0A8B6GMG3_MYTGA|nr:Hypothetical predicted protein [Mytilus galloprovincialis]
MSYNLKAQQQHWWNCKTQLKFVKGCLFYKWLDPAEPRILLLLPKSLKEEAMKYCHDCKTAGHFGQAKTIQKLQQRFIWYQMRMDAILYVQTCSICNINKKSNRTAKGALGQCHAGAPMERVHMDMLGLLVESYSNNKYVLAIIDQFTKWIEFVPLPNQNAETIAKAAVNDFFSKFGCALQIHTDQGRNFDSNLFMNYVAY